MRMKFYQFGLVASLVAGFSANASAQGTEQLVGVQVVAKTSTQIGAPMSGTIIDFPMVDGSSFKEGDVVVKFQCNQQDASLAHAKAQQAKFSGILATQRQLKELGTYSQVEYRTAGAELQAATAEVALATANQENCIIKAPFSGRVSNIAVRNHQFVQAGAPMMDILSDKELELETIVPSVWLTWLKPDVKFSVKVLETDKTYSATLVRISGRVDPVSRTIKVYGKVDGAIADLLPGMSGNAKFEMPK